MVYLLTMVDLSIAMLVITRGHMKSKDLEREGLSAMIPRDLFLRAHHAAASRAFSGEAPNVWHGLFCWSREFFFKPKFSMRCCPSGQRWAGGSTQIWWKCVWISGFQHCHEISHVTSLLFMGNFPMFMKKIIMADGSYIVISPLNPIKTPFFYGLWPSRREKFRPAAAQL